MRESSSHPYLYAVKFSSNSKAYTFKSSDNQYQKSDPVVVETSRGIEYGFIESSLSEDTKVIEADLKPILRKASQKDTDSYLRNQDASIDALTICAELIRDLNLDMKLISAEYTLDRSKLIYVYVADERVDFRDLVRELASKLHTRIELKQIGPRDKAKMVGAIGVCGQETCCSRFMTGFDVVSINMAKNQMLALNIPKLSGMCGKLMCCLKFEDENYKCMKEGCPKLYEQIEYDGKRYRVASMNVITQQARLDTRDESLVLSFDQAFKDYRRDRDLKKNHETTKELSE